MFDRKPSNYGIQQQQQNYGRSTVGVLYSSVYSVPPSRNVSSVYAQSAPYGYCIYSMAVYHNPFIQTNVHWGSIDAAAALSTADSTVTASTRSEYPSACEGTVINRTPTVLYSYCSSNCLVVQSWFLMQLIPCFRTRKIPYPYVYSNPSLIQSTVRGGSSSQSGNVSKQLHRVQ